MRRFDSQSRWYSRRKDPPQGGRRVYFPFPASWSFFAASMPRTHTRTHSPPRPGTRIRRGLGRALFRAEAKANVPLLQSYEACTEERCKAPAHFDHTLQRPRTNGGARPFSSTPASPPTIRNAYKVSLTHSLTLWACDHTLPRPEGPNKLLASTPRGPHGRSRRAAR